MAVTGDLARYRYISRIGSGGMARVDLAEDTLLGRQVALKRVSGLTDEHGPSRLHREALAGASLSHPNLVSVYDVVTSDDGHPVVVMEYVRGGTLRTALDERGKLPAPEAIRILEGVAAGLDAIHQRGIVHRDVKPSNILLGEDGAVKVADLGIAALPDRTRITVSGSVIGSLSYMAPEQLDSAPSTPAVDIYALAAVAYEMLSGQKARPETNAVTLAHAIATQPPPNLRDTWPQAPPAAADLLARGMARDPAQRPRSAGELVARLKSALGSDAPTAATAPIAPPRPAHPGRRGAAAAAAGLAGAGAGAAGAQAAGSRGRPAAGAPPRRTAAAGAPPRRSVGPAPPPPADEPRRGHGGLVAAGVLGAVAVIVALAVLLNSGGSPAHRAASTHTHGAAGTRAHHHSATAASSSHTSTASATSSSAPAASATTSAPAASTTTPTASASSSSTAPAAAGGAAPPATGSAGSPVGAVKTFYGDAAAHNYAAAWSLADPALRSQLGGYSSFKSGQAGDRSITFQSAKVVSHSGNSATVAIRTTSVRDNGTQHCTGSVAVVSAGSGKWQLHQLQNIVCS